MADMGLATREDDHGDRIEPEGEMGRSGATPWGCFWSQALGSVKQRKQRKMMSRNLVAPALDRSGNEVVEVSWCARKEGTGRTGYAGEEVRLVPDMASGGEAAGRVGASYLRGGGGEEGEEEDGKP
ncbi:hypothetical protein TRIUR3_25032 [Triticum urartu]|uniref:Uncharacterized protein n=1 Tax=Triticum urartu TaxID=4572 RepID=M7Z3L4_TRIUA|nr:hypothetical protein TRIUR3_25032 [Triticum urartu]